MFPGRTLKENHVAQISRKDFISHKFFFVAGIGVRYHSRSGPHMTTSGYIVVDLLSNDLAIETKPRTIDTSAIRLDACQTDEIT